MNIRHAVSGAVVVAALGAGSAFGASQAGPDAAPTASDAAVVRELRAMNRELRRINARLGTRSDTASLTGQTARVVRNTYTLCRQVSEVTCYQPFDDDEAP